MTATRNRRVGTLTLGISLIGMGGLFLTHILMPSLISYSFIFRLWPLILICLGMEVILAYVINKEQHFLYDGWAVFIMIGMMCFSAAMAAVQILFEYGRITGNITI
ncbi:hypothetical protein [Sinanaerobacter chloroacetimidivorans]|jgi:hypothetical protein|uniref:DUF5668 domain-containing protein n=1 Tax=Sinanaerobacter chloroacetimidivorans TaxID=2818044 RepID=A0A8J7VXX2_9FIRM|nr:hypothetical protein [Sinanaerobacter chloroacetimidivorans]MBR0597074.1 hypothetical protein [Sinanaerobacter chloroacetimidivorans]